MKIIRICISIVLMFVLFSGISLSSAAMTTKGILDTPNKEEKFYCNAKLEDNFAEDRILVVLNRQESSKFNTNTFSFLSAIDYKEIQQINLLTKNIIVSTLERISQISSDAPLEEALVVEGLKAVNANNYREVLRISLTEPGKENVLKAIKILQDQEEILYVGPDYILTLSSTIPNDASYNYQSTVSNKIKLPQAWDIQTSASTVIVGVLDSGINCDHPDLEDRIAYDLCNSFLNGFAETDYFDNNGHGTHVAGIIGARGNNEIGVCGVCWNVQLASLKIANPDKKAYSSIVALGIDFATDEGIDILNFSGVWDSRSQEAYLYDVALNTIISSYPGLFVCSAGNSGIDCDPNNVYPADYNLNNMITVGASTTSDEIESYSNYGATTVDIFAPGTVYSCLRNGGYGYKSGTSMSAPLVTGVAALYLAKNPNATASEIKNVILSCADSLVAFNGKCTSGGRLNAYAVLSHTHNCSNYTSVSLAKHRGTCNTCGTTFFQAHTFAPSGSFQVCTKCGYSIQLMK